MSLHSTPFSRRITAVALLLCAGFGIATGAVLVTGPAPSALWSPAAPLLTTPEDFKQPGTQPGTLQSPIKPSTVCANCHGGYDEAQEPYTRWATSLMAQSARDPIFHACLAIAEQDVAHVGDLCIRCHSPGGWLEGNSSPSDGSALAGKDYEGVTCHVCHRLVDPVADPANPPEDAGILAGLGTAVPVAPHTGQYVLDPQDRRRGPFDLGPAFPWHEWRQSPFHQESLLCANCHDVSNPAYTRVGGPVPSASDTYALNDTNKQHGTHDKFDEFPVERTFSEWSQSEFAQGPVDMGGLFGGNKQLVSSCQDCHMPDASGVACGPGFGGTFRDDLPLHDFNGANTWVLKAIESLDQSLALYGPAEASVLSQLPAGAVDDAIARNVSMLQRASDLELSLVDGELAVRIVNNSGHKLPSGYPEGRRMWINVRFFDALGALVDERGAYDAASADLTTGDTKVYEMELGLDAAMAAKTGLPEGVGFHFALNNKIYKDNRIPPRGFTNAGFEAIQAAPVAASYADGQHWDDTLYDIPCGAVSAEVRVYYQTTSKEYIEFLRDANVTNDRGQIAYDQWVLHGKSAPAEMDFGTLALVPRLGADKAELSLAAGGVQNLCLTAGSGHGGALYLLAGSASGTSPGIVLGGQLVPLNPDPYLSFTVGSPNTPPLGGSLGFLGGLGNGSATVTVPAGATGPGLAGLVLHHAYAILTTSVAAVSNPVSLTLLP